MAEAVAAERLQSFVARIERLEEEKAALAADAREVYAEAKSGRLRHQNIAPSDTLAETGQE